MGGFLTAGPNGQPYLGVTITRVVVMLSDHEACRVMFRRTFSVECDDDVLTLDMPNVGIIATDAFHADKAFGYAFNVPKYYCYPHQGFLRLFYERLICLDARVGKSKIIILRYALSVRELRVIVELDVRKCQHEVRVFDTVNCDWYQFPADITGAV